jgi:hypothetical protein
MFINTLPVQAYFASLQEKGGIKREIYFHFKTLNVKFATQLVVFLMALMVTPLMPIKEQANSNIELTFDKNSPIALSSPEGDIEIKISTPSYRSVAQTQVKAYSNQHNDPTSFRPLYMAAGARFNVPWQLIEAVHQVESGKSGSTAKRSYAGAVGPMQFMPGTWRAYAVDGNADGNADITDVTDAIYTAAHYLAKSGADEGRIQDAVFNYNHSNSYVRTVVSIAQEIGYTPMNN